MESYHHKGHTCIPSLLTREEISLYQPAIYKTVEKYFNQMNNIESTVSGQDQRWGFIKALMLLNLWRLNPICRRLVLSKKLGGVAAQLMGVSKVRLFRDQSYFKYPGGERTPWHQDAYFLPLAYCKTVTFWIALGTIAPDMSPMRYVDGSHRFCFLGKITNKENVMNELEVYFQDLGCELTTYNNLKPGEAIVHTGWTIHGCPPNTSSKLCQALAIVYYEDGSQVSFEYLIFFPTFAPVFTLAEQGKSDCTYLTVKLFLFLNLRRQVFHREIIWRLRCFEFFKSYIHLFICEVFFHP
ncbi:MAG: phytanoyl-CoA dioxygenase family protein [Trichodesmium sp. St16_bin4-tuft]|nr:phytanoyl-CoA dioxygenase family protein [Trichodesmium sp. St16_bin4-tuft]